MAITTAGTKGKITPEAALALSTPIAVGIQFLQTATYTAFAGAPETAKKLCKQVISEDLKLQQMVQFGHSLDWDLV